MASDKLSVDLIVKLGGSAITEKDKLETLRSDSLEQASHLVEKCLHNRLKVILVHGAGSFGHHQAKQYSVNSGFLHLDPAEQQEARLGFSHTHVSVSKLNSYVVHSLVKHGVPAVPCSPCSSWMTSDRVVTTSGCDSVRELVMAGFVPVLHGDTVVDSQLGGCILSGDTIIKTLCQQFDVERVVFLTDVRGVYDRPPDQTGAVLLPSLTVKEDGSLQASVSTSLPSHDVTGGIRLKLQTAVDIVTWTHGRTTVHVCQLGSGGADRLCGKEGGQSARTDGTEIRLAS